MLKGRESLVRLIRRQRRFLTNRHTVLSSSSLSSHQDEKQKKDAIAESSDSASESAKRLVCGNQFPGQDNASINSHLDERFKGGSKRKLNQLTLLQLNFSRSRVKVHDLQPGHTGQHLDLSNPIAINYGEIIRGMNDQIVLKGVTMRKKSQLTVSWLRVWSKRRSRF